MGWHPAPAGARTLRRRTARLVAVLLAVVVLLACGISTASADRYKGTTDNGVNRLRTDTLAPPTAAAVSQACVTDPMPVQRSPGGSSFTSGTSSGSLTIARPTGAQVGDVMIASIVWRTENVITDASGLWTPVFSPQLVSAAVSQSVYYRVVTASEPASYTWTGSLHQAAGGVAAYSGVDTVTPVNASSGQANGTMAAPSLTTTRSNVRLVGLWAIEGARTVSAPAGMTQIWNGSSNGTGGAALQAMSVAADEPWPSPGATGTRTLTGSSGNGISQLVALQPPRRPFATTTWTTSSSTYATGQVFRRGSGSTVQRQATLSATVTSQTDGPLVSGTSYTVDVTATFASWTSLPAAVSFSGLAC